MCFRIGLLKFILCIVVRSLMIFKEKKNGTQHLKGGLKKMRLPKKQKQVIRMLVKEGMINSEEQIITIALFDYFKRLGYFDLVDEYFKKTKKKKKEVSNSSQD